MALSIFDETPNSIEYRYPAYRMSLVDPNSGGYSVVFFGYGNQLEDGRVRDIVAGLSVDNLVNWQNCSKIDLEEVESPFPETP